MLRLLHLNPWPHASNARALPSSARAVLALTAVIAACTHAVVRAEHDEPAPEPRQSEEPSNGAIDGASDEPDDRAERRELQREADYLALADAPVFLPRSYLYWGTPVGAEPRRQSLVFALEYALHLPIYNDVRDKALTGRSFAGAVTLSFEGDLRMLAVTSKPVRMPSYRPSLSGQLFYIVHRDQPLLFGLRLGFFHYSNGQERCAFNAEVSDESDECRTLTRNVQDPQRQLNNRSGDFSSNGWLIEGYGRLHQVNSKGVAIAHLALGFRFAGPIERGPGAIEKPTQELYGWGRIGGTFEVKKRFGWAVITARASVDHYLRVDDRIPSLAGSAEGVLGPYWLTGFGFFGRYYGGRDFYNAFFVDELHQLAVGLAWDGERPLKFKRDEEE